MCKFRMFISPTSICIRPIVRPTNAKATLPITPKSFIPFSKLTPKDDDQDFKGGYKGKAQSIWVGNQYITPAPLTEEEARYNKFSSRIKGKKWARTYVSSKNLPQWVRDYFNEKDYESVLDLANEKLNNSDLTFEEALSKATNQVLLNAPEEFIFHTNKITGVDKYKKDSQYSTIKRCLRNGINVTVIDDFTHAIWILHAVANDSICPLKQKFHLNSVQAVAYRAALNRYNDRVEKALEEELKELKSEYYVANLVSYGRRVEYAKEYAIKEKLLAYKELLPKDYTVEDLYENIDKILHTVSIWASAFDIDVNTSYRELTEINAYYLFKSEYKMHNTFSTLPNTKIQLAKNAGFVDDSIHYNKKNGFIYNVGEQGLIWIAGYKDQLVCTTCLQDSDKDRVLLPVVKDLYTPFVGKPKYAYNIKKDFYEYKDTPKELIDPRIFMNKTQIQMKHNLNADLTQVVQAYHQIRYYIKNGVENFLSDKYVICECGRPVHINAEFCQYCYENNNEYNGEVKIMSNDFMDNMFGVSTNVYDRVNDLIDLINRVSADDETCADRIDFDDDLMKKSKKSKKSEKAPAPPKVDDADYNPDNWYDAESNLEGCPVPEGIHNAVVTKIEDKVSKESNKSYKLLTLLVDSTMITTMQVYNTNIFLGELFVQGVPVATINDIINVQFKIKSTVKGTVGKLTIVDKRPADLGMYKAVFNGIAFDRAHYCGIIKYTINGVQYNDVRTVATAEDAKQIAKVLSALVLQFGEIPANMKIAPATLNKYTGKEMYIKVMTSEKFPHPFLSYMIYNSDLKEITEKSNAPKF